MYVGTVSTPSSCIVIKEYILVNVERAAHKLLIKVYEEIVLCKRLCLNLHVTIRILAQYGTIRFAYVLQTFWLIIV